MTNRSELTRLANIAEMLSDHRLHQLRSSAQLLEQSRMQLSTLNQSQAASELDPITAAKIELSYQAWADVRRAELNLVISRQTATWLEARKEAQTAFGRVLALKGLATRFVGRR